MIDLTGNPILTQIIGIIASALVITGFANKKDNNFKFFIMLGSLGFVCHYLMLGAYAGAAANVVNAARTGLSIKFHKSNGMMIFFIAAYLAMGFLTYEEPVDALPVFSGILATFAMFRLSGIKMRLCFFVSSTSWLIYDFIFKSIGGIITEGFVQFTNITTIYRLLRDKKKVA